MLKSGWLFACDPTLLHMLIFGKKKQTSQENYRTLIFLIILGYMQKVSHFSAQLKKKNAKCQLGHFCPEPFYWS